MFHLFTTLYRSRIKGRSAAFTLLELLIVVAIISIIAAILFPVFGRARENARRLSCQSNLKQCGVVIAQYLGDCDGLYPPSWDAANGAILSDTNQVRPWPLLLQPYIKNTQILQCPSATGLEGTLPAMQPWRDSLGLQNLPVHYSYNYYIGGEIGNMVGSQYGVKMASQIVRPSEVILMADSGSIPPWDETPARPSSTPSEEWMQVRGMDDKGKNYSSYLLVDCGSLFFARPSYGTIANRHLSTTNILWADGHVKAMKPAQVMLLSADADYTTPPTSCFNPIRGCTGRAGL